MLSFRFILLVAAAFATIASTIPTTPPVSRNVGGDSIVNIINSLGDVIGNILFPPDHDLPCLPMNFQVHYFSIQD